MKKKFRECNIIPIYLENQALLQRIRAVECYNAKNIWLLLCHVSDVDLYLNKICCCYITWCFNQSDNFTKYLKNQPRDVIKIRDIRRKLGVNGILWRSDGKSHV